MHMLYYTIFYIFIQITAIISVPLNNISGKNFTKIFVNLKLFTRLYNIWEMEGYQ